MKHKIDEQHERLFYAISTIAGHITDRCAGSEVGGAYDLARHIQLAIENVLGQDEDNDGSMIWKIGD